MDRVAVYRLIDGERNHQDAKCGRTLSGNQSPTPGTKGGDRSVDEFALYINGYAVELMQTASHFGGECSKLDIVRKIAGLCVHCMEQHGAPPRISE